MIWFKTDAGRAEIQARALIKERSQRNLLLLIDGVKTDEMLLTSVAGSKPEDFALLESLHLIAPGRRAVGAAPSAPMPLTEPMSLDILIEPVSVPPAAEGESIDYARFTATLTKLISSELGLRGFTLTLAVEKANSIEELRSVANRVLDQIRDRKGLPAAEKARQALYGA